MNGEFKLTCKCWYCVGVREGRKEGARNELNKLMEYRQQIIENGFNWWKEERLKELGGKQNEKN